MTISFRTRLRDLYPHLQAPPYFRTEAIIAAP